MSATESLTAIQRSPKPNSAFFAPNGVETLAQVDVRLEDFELSADKLFSYAVDVFGGQKNTRITNRDEAVKRASFVCTTPLLRFKDDVDLEAVNTGDGRSGLILFSRSRVGYSDLGTNRKRLAHWVEQLNHIVKNA